MEYVEVQQFLNRRQTYVDDLERRKAGSKKHNDDQAYIHAYDRRIDDLRTGKEPGHFEKEYEELKRKEKSEGVKAREESEKKRAIKNKEKFVKYRTDMAEINTRLKKQGFEYDLDEKKWIGEVKSIDEPENPGRNITATENKKFQTDYKDYLQQQVDFATIQKMKTEIHENYFSDYDNKRLKAWEFKNENFVKDHTIKGVVMFSNGEKDFVKNMEKQFNDPGIPKWTLENVKSISMFKSSIP